MATGVRRWPFASGDPRLVLSASSPAPPRPAGDRQPVLHIRRDVQGRFVVANLAVSADGKSDDTAAVDWCSPRSASASMAPRWSGRTNSAVRRRWSSRTSILHSTTTVAATASAWRRCRHPRWRRASISAAILSAMTSPRWMDGKVSCSPNSTTLIWRAGSSGWTTRWPAARPRCDARLAGHRRGRLLDLTTDVALEDVRLQLARNLPELRLSLLQAARCAFAQRGFSASARDLGFALEDGVRVPPTDFSVDWQATGDGKSVQGSGTASRMDLQRLTMLSRYLPLDAATRKRLDDYAPAGEIADLRLSFRATRKRCRPIAACALRQPRPPCAGLLPGFFGLSGNLEATEKGGNMTLRSQASGLDLPSVFPEPRLLRQPWCAGALEDRWRQGRRPAAGRVRGSDALARARQLSSYRRGPGVIDLTATLSRARGDAVWRYMPHAVNAEARGWLRQGITGGNASDARLTLKGDLAHFPFTAGGGTFLVTAKAHDVTLDYAPGWPQLEHIDGDLRFEGAGMRVDARSGALFGTRISNTVAEIPDFDAANPR